MTEISLPSCVLQGQGYLSIFLCKAEHGLESGIHNLPIEMNALLKRDVSTIIYCNFESTFVVYTWISCYCFVMARIIDV
jgi:hypothetical protein